MSNHRHGRENEYQTKEKCYRSVIFLFFWAVLQPQGDGKYKTRDYQCQQKWSLGACKHQTTRAVLPIKVCLSVCFKVVDWLTDRLCYPLGQAAMMSKTHPVNTVLPFPSSDHLWPADLALTTVICTYWSQMAWQLAEHLSRRKTLPSLHKWKDACVRSSSGCSS